MMPSWLRGPEQGFVRPFCFCGDVPASKPGTAFHRGFLDLDSFGHDPGSVRPPFGPSWSMFSGLGFSQRGVSVPFSYFELPPPLS